MSKESNESSPNLDISGFGSSISNWMHSSSSEVFGTDLVFDVPGVHMTEIARRLQNWYEAQSLETQVLELEDGIVVQCRRLGTWRKWTGTNSEMTVTLKPEQSRLVARVGPGKWASKVGAGSLGVVMGTIFPILLPLVATAAYGSWEQRQLRVKTIEIISQVADEVKVDDGEVP